MLIDYAIGGAAKPSSPTIWGLKKSEGSEVVKSIEKG
jgi:hypothetical protein